jgi:hypothetical protein
MAILTRDELRILSAEASPPCASLYMPTHRAGVETQQNPIRLKNLLRQTEELLQQAQAPRATVEQLLQPARRLLEDFGFWQHQSDGLALFLAPGFLRRYRLPLAFEELVVVGERFHLAPLLPLLTGDGRFHILALSQKKVRLFEATRHKLRELDLHDIPESLAEALGYDFEQRSLLFHSATGALSPATARVPRSTGVGPAVHTAGRSRAMFHGHGAGNDEVKKDEITRFLQLVDQGLLRLLRNGTAPLVVAAVDYEAAIYREVSKHPQVMPEAVEGSPEGLSSAELHHKAWRVVEDHFRREQQEAVGRFHDLVGAGRTAEEVETVLPAAADGRVDTLFLPVGARRWGRFDPQTREVELLESAGPEGEDLLDRAALETLLHSGDVFAVPPAELPGGADVAAILRY